MADQSGKGRGGRWWPDELRPRQPGGCGPRRPLQTGIVPSGSPSGRGSSDPMAFPRRALEAAAAPVPSLPRVQSSHACLPRNLIFPSRLTTGLTSAQAAAMAAAGGVAAAAGLGSAMAAAAAAAAAAASLPTAAETAAATAMPTATQAAVQAAAAAAALPTAVDTAAAPSAMHAAHAAAAMAAAALPISPPAPLLTALPSAAATAAVATPASTAMSPSGGEVPVDDAIQSLLGLAEGSSSTEELAALSSGPWPHWQASGSGPADAVLRRQLTQQNLVHARLRFPGGCWVLGAGCWVC